MNNESRLKRLAWCAAATCIAVAIWLVFPFLLWFFSGRIIIGAIDTALTAAVICCVLYLLSSCVLNKNVFIVLLFACIIGIIIHVLHVYVLTVILLPFKKGSMLENMVRVLLELLMCMKLIIHHSVLFGELPLAAFVVMIYRYFPRWFGMFGRALQKN